jgi:hypothetical protein
VRARAHITNNQPNDKRTKSALGFSTAALGHEHHCDGRRLTHFRRSARGSIHAGGAHTEQYARAQLFGQHEKEVVRYGPVEA